ncbi:hypothetical protein KIL84_007713 [Mauremys mutica]|uniref:Uncharacterized protein n=1 Tax=Mauremys mutica TaxID=74926 RepID=A0A9D4AXB4_9SAUR|nr:hypothetical protein KIL84_007713 [Mauremys mutica]
MTAILKYKFLGSNGRGRLLELWEMLFWNGPRRSTQAEKLSVILNIIQSQCKKLEPCLVSQCGSSQTMLEMCFVMVFIVLKKLDCPPSNYRISFIPSRYEVNCSL